MIRTSTDAWPFAVPLLCQHPVPRTSGVVTGDMVHHRLQWREPDWSSIVDRDANEAAASRHKFLGSLADTGTLILPIHFPTSTTGRIRADGNRFR